MATLEIRDLHVTVASEQGDKEILRGVDLTVRAGESAGFRQRYAAVSGGRPPAGLQQRLPPLATLRRDLRGDLRGQ